MDFINSINKEKSQSNDPADLLHTDRTNVPTIWRNYLNHGTLILRSGSNRTNVPMIWRNYMNHGTLIVRSGGLFLQN